MGQDDMLLVYGKFRIEKGSLDGAKIIIKKNGIEIETVNMKRSGNFSFELEYGSIYILSFAKANYVTKKISINTKIPSNVNSSAGYEFDFEVSIFKQLSGVNTMIFNQPVGKIMYNAMMDDFDYDTDYSKTIRTKIENAERQMKEKEREIEKQGQAETKKLAEEERANQIAQIQAEAEARKKADEERARLAAAEKAKRIAQLQADAEARKKAEAEAKAKRLAEIEARKNEEAEKQRLAEEEKDRAKAEAQAKKLQEVKDEQERQRLEEEARAKAEADALAKKLEQLKKEAAERKDADEESAKAEAEALAKKIAQMRVEAEARKKAEAEARLEEQKRAKAQADARAKIISEKKAEKEKEKNEARARARAHAKEVIENRNKVATVDMFPNKKTVETINKNDRDITRIIMNNKGKITIFLKVKYHWGGKYYFMEDPEQQIRSISEAFYESSTFE
ncbi:MAG: hypothetical protein KAT68_01180 [Bacteroidales bacterium]|nr:hypothetical protein [Bacteroidales bacterium]